MKNIFIFGILMFLMGGLLGAGLALRWATKQIEEVTKETSSLSSMLVGMRRELERARNMPELKSIDNNLAPFTDDHDVSGLLEDD